MINLDQIEEWIHEAEQRPSSSAVIIRYIAGRLRDLTSRNEDLLAENIELRTGRKVEEYESRIANLEYQLDLLKRQFSGEGLLSAAPQAAVETLSFVIYNLKGQVLRFEQPVVSLASRITIGSLEAPTNGGPPRLLVTRPVEELLFVFDTGRTESLPVTAVPVANPERLDWKQAYLVEPHGGEELSAVLPIARMTLADCCVQVSRRGCAKKMMKNAFESHVAKSFIGSGVKGKPDKTCNLILCGKDDVMVLATREGYLLSMDVVQLPYTIEEMLKLSATDYVVNSFVTDRSSTLLIVTQNGKVINREISWLEKANSTKSRGQAVFSQSRREAGVRVAGASVVDVEDWGLALNSDGDLSLYKVTDLLADGSLSTEPSEAEIAEFVTFSLPGKGNS